MEFLDEKECLYSGSHGDSRHPNAHSWLWHEPSETEGSLYFKLQSPLLLQWWLFYASNWKKKIMGKFCCSSNITQKRGADTRNELWRNIELLSMLIPVNILDRENSKSLSLNCYKVRKIQIPEQTSCYQPGFPESLSSISTKNNYPFFFFPYSVKAG